MPRNGSNYNLLSNISSYIRHMVLLLVLSSQERYALNHIQITATLISICIDILEKIQFYTAIFCPLRLNSRLYWGETELGWILKMGYMYRKMWYLLLSVFCSNQLSGHSFLHFPAVSHHGFQNRQRVGADRPFILLGCTCLIVSLQSQKWVTQIKSPIPFLDKNLLPSCLKVRNTETKREN